MKAKVNRGKKGPPNTNFGIEPEKAPDENEIPDVVVERLHYDGSRKGQVWTVEYAPGNEIEYRYRDGTFKSVEAGPWAVIDSQIFDGGEPQIQGVWYFGTKTEAEEFVKLKTANKEMMRKPKSGDILMFCGSCGTYDFQADFELNEFQDSCKCPNCDAEEAPDNLKWVFL